MKSEPQVSKLLKTKVTILVCSNAAGHLIKPGFLHKSANPRCTKGKNKSLLPVFWQSNKKAWVTVELFKEWFHKCFVPEVKIYLEEKGMPFKVLLTLDNAGGHPEELKTANENVEILFFPANTTSILQPLDQGVIRCFKAAYVRLSITRIRNFIDEDPNASVMNCWKSFNIADCVDFVKEAMDQITPRTVSACWKNLWSDCVTDFEGFPTPENDIANIVAIAHQVGGDGFEDLQREEIEEVIAGNKETLTNEELVELVSSVSDPEDDDEENAAVNDWDLNKLGELFRMLKQVNNFIVDNDPSMERSLNIKRKVENDFLPYRELFNELKRQKSQLPITMYFSKKQPTQITDLELPSSSTPSTSKTTAAPSSPTQSDPDDPSIIII